MLKKNHQKKWFTASVLNAFALASCFIFYSVGCGNSDSPIEGTNQESHGQANHKEQPANILKPTIKLLDLGAEPRRKLRYSLQAQESGRFNIEMSWSLTAETEDTPMPLVRFTASLSMKPSTPDGGMPLKITHDEIEVINTSRTSPELFIQFKEMFNSMQGMVFIGIMSSQGLYEDVDLKLPKNLHPEVKKHINDIKETYNSCALPLPKDAIGKGARWQVSMPFTVEGIKGTQVSTITLKDIQGDKVMMEFTTKQTASKQKFNVPGTPGIKDELLSHKSTGTGKFEGSLTGFTDAKYEIEETQNQTLSVNGAEMKMMIKLGIVTSPQAP